MTSIGKVPNMKWTLQMVDLGRVPPGKLVTEAQALAKYPNLAGYEHLEEIGVPGYTTDVPFLRAKKCKTMEEFYGIDLTAERSNSLSVTGDRACHPTTCSVH